MSFQPAQSRAARALLGWSQGELSAAAGVARATIAEFEGGRRMPISNNLQAIRTALESAGVQFVGAGETAEGPGVVLRDSER